MDAVIGCDAIDAGPDWLRLKTAMGSVRTVPWASVKAAGFVMPGQSISIQHVSEKAEPYLATHEALWIAYEEGLAMAMIEKPRRDTMIATFAQQLGERWKGDRLTGNDLMDGMIPSAFHRPRGMPPAIKIMIAATAALILFGIVAGYIAGSHR